MTENLPLSIADALALFFFIISWVGYGYAVDKKLVGRLSLTQAMDAQREAWMHTMARRELRMIDTGIMAGLQQGTAFFASSTLIALGGCFALLGATDRVLAVLSDLPYFTQPARGVLEMKTIGLIVLFAYAFFKFGWSYRLFNYCSILVGAVPLIRDGVGHSAEIETAVRRAAQMNILAGRHFNAGLRGVFFSIGYLGWFVSPVVLVGSTILLLLVLARRQFFSAARRAVMEPQPSSRRREDVVDIAGEPVTREADPFPNSNRRELQ
ncbi:DUF599 family protein [Mesorhizobium sp. BAC0120]|uniref:DUF599 domain-containing protein n=1 Tax=Mesorhizobium sp. BAC0120 TaxID=3090670 RepID=UPI00298CA607|nr:DUF599 family protein [Mesorhizobium sp. BAC0120]MDW6022799.1 DUF599 family protein [Mesorhizobium sp. BAC0120]